MGVSKIWSLWGFAFTLLLHVLFVCPTLHFFGNRGPRWDPWILGHFQQIFFAKFHGFFGTTSCTRKPCALHGDTSAERECFVSLSQYPMSTVCYRHTLFFEFVYFLYKFSLCTAFIHLLLLRAIFCTPSNVMYGKVRYCKVMSLFAYYYWLICLLLVRR